MGADQENGMVADALLEVTEPSSVSVQVQVASFVSV